MHPDVLRRLRAYYRDYIARDVSVDRYVPESTFILRTGHKLKSKDIQMVTVYLSSDVQASENEFIFMF